MISYRSDSRYPHKRSVRSSRYFQSGIYSSGYPQTSGKYTMISFEYVTLGILNPKHPPSNKFHKGTDAGVYSISVLNSKFIFSLQGRGLAKMKMAKPKLTITPPPNTYNSYSLDLLSKLNDDLAIIGKLNKFAWRRTSTL